MKTVEKKGSSWKWFYPGMEVKRWLILLLVGVTILGLGLGYVLRDIYATQAFPPTVYYLTLQFIPRWARALLLGAIGIAAVISGVIQLNRSLLSAVLPPGQAPVVDMVYEHRQRSRGPKVVAIGGGTGLATLLRGLKTHTHNITAIVTVADDGGSSGRLRRELGVLPPGDFRNCIVALADAESLTTQLFQYRFREIPANFAESGSSLDGHNFGNLFIIAMAEVAGGFERALVESGKVLAIRGRILPSTLQNVTLCAELADEVGQGQLIAGESQIPKACLPIERVYLEPGDARAYPEALRAILDADLIVAGPGSLFTSVLPNLLVPDISQAICASKAARIYVCNVAMQPGETEGFTVGDHVSALQRHVGEDTFPYVLANSNFAVTMPECWSINLVPVDYPLDADYTVMTADLIDEKNPWRHDPDKLATWLLDWYKTR
jgi:uncharacterized cofD-like protein